MKKLIRDKESRMFTYFFRYTILHVCIKMEIIPSTVRGDVAEENVINCRSEVL